jgi:hypothetical protein
LKVNGTELLNRSVSDFDCYNLREVVGLLWVSKPQGPALILTMRYEFENSASVPITFRCRGVRQMKLPIFGPNFFLSELEIEDLAASQLEGIRFRLQDYSSGFELACLGLEVVGAGSNGVHVLSEEHTV